MASTKEFLKRVYDLELSCYKQRNYLLNLRQQLENARNPSYYKLECEDKATNAVVNTVGGAFVGLYYAFGGAAAGFILAVISGFFSIFSNHPRFPIEFIFMGAILTFGVYFAYSAFKAQEEAEEIRESNERAKENNKRAREENLKIQQHSQVSFELLKAELSRAEKTCKKTQEALTVFYNTNIIYKKYWGIVPVAMFLEYFESGRCHTLPEAYDRYEQESRLDLIITKLDDIIQRLDQIESNQYMLAESIRKANQEIQYLNSAVNAQTQKLEQIAENQEVADYYNRVNAMNTSYLAWVAFKNR